VSLNQNYICIQGDFAKDIFSFVKIDETIPCFIKNDPYLIAHNFIDRFSKFFHPQTQQRSYNELIIKGPITP